MYGFGDDEVPYTESVDLLEDMLIAYIIEMVGNFSTLFMVDAVVTTIDHTI